MAATEVQRTLVKSPPELWAELSDAESLARHLSGLGEIRITRLEPESEVAWEAERASGTILIRPSGWGTRVKLSVEVGASLRTPVDPPTAPETAPAAPQTSPASPQTSAASPQTSAASLQTPAEPPTAPAAAETSPGSPQTPGDPPTAPAAAETSPGPAETVDTATGPRREPTRATARPGSEPLAWHAEAPGVEVHVEPADAVAATVAAVPAAAGEAPEQAPEHPPRDTAVARPEPAPRQPGFLARLMGRLRRRAEADDGAAPPEELAAPADRTRPPGADPVAEPRARTDHARGLPEEPRSPVEAPHPSPPGSQPAPGAPEEPGGGAIESLQARFIVARPEAQDAPTPPEPKAEASLHVPEATHAGIGEEQITVLLTAMLDSLGAAHHRPFSRA